MLPPPSLHWGLPSPSSSCPSPPPVIFSLATALALTITATSGPNALCTRLSRPLDREQRTRTQLFCAECFLLCAPCLVTTLFPGHNCPPWRLLHPQPLPLGLWTNTLPHLVSRIPAHSRAGWALTAQLWCRPEAVMGMTPHAPRWPCPCSGLDVP